MSMRRTVSIVAVSLAAITGWLGLGGTSSAAELDGSALPLAWSLPFLLLIAAMALLPLFAGPFWERYQVRIVGLIGAVLLAAMAAALGPWVTMTAAAHTILLDYIPFVLLLTTLFTVAGGIVVRGNLHGTPFVNAVLLAVGTALASVIGTTGASMVMIRPLLRANDDRRHNVHTVVFFIFLVSNIGGSLTPLGDPPLFLGYLHGVPFFWTLEHLLAPMLVSSGIVLAVFIALDMVLYRREGRLSRDPTPDSPLRLAGWINIGLVLLVGLVTILGGSVDLGQVALGEIRLGVAGVVRDLTLVAIIVVSLRSTPSELHELNGFSFAPMREVAVLFAGIFITLIPVLAMLEAGVAGAFGPLLNVVYGPTGQPNDVAFFWLTGALSSFLDNAPTYLVFFGLAGGDAQHLTGPAATTLTAISAGAVFMGANSYIGNAPNLMVSGIARARGVRMPHFFGYLGWSALVLVPTFVVISYVFFRA